MGQQHSPLVLKKEKPNFKLYGNMHNNLAQDLGQNLPSDQDLGGPLVA